MQCEGRKAVRNLQRRAEFTPDLPMLEEHIVVRHS